jgi:tRNA pseudouridine32 synthase/23S rRNA pseudouridine746 synthase
VHLQSIGHSILGDHLYASDDVQAKSARLLLHASELHLTHPVSGKTLAFECVCPF